MTRRTARRALSVSLLSMALAQNAYAAPGNADFDDAVDASWTFGANASIVASHANSGTKAAFSNCVGGGCLGSDANGITGTSTFHQDLNLDPGIYRLIYNVRVDSTAATYGVGASLGTNVTRLSTNFSATADVYQQFTDYSAVAGGVTRLKFGLRHDPSNIHLDDVSLVMVDDGAGNNLGAASQTIAAQASFGFLDRLQDRFGHSGSPVQIANAREAVYAASGNSGYRGGNGRYRAHMSAYGDRGKWDGGDVKSQRWGISAGAEMAATDSVDLGFALAAGHGRFNTDTAFTDNRAKNDEFLGAIYGHFGPQSIPLYLTAAAGYGYSTNDFTRTSTMGLGAVTARDVEATQIFASVELGYDWKISNAFILTPYARADGAMIDQDAYAEIPLSGADLVPAVVGAVDVDAARTILGARGALDITAGRRGARLTASAGWAHEFERDRAVAFTQTTGPVTFAGVATGATPVADSVVAGANIEAPVSDEARFFAGYNGNFGSGQDIHAGEVGLRVVW